MTEVIGSAFGAEKAVAFDPAHVGIRWSRWASETAEDFGARVLRDAEAAGIAAVRFGGAANSSAAVAPRPADGDMGVGTRS